MLPNAAEWQRASSVGKNYIRLIAEHSIGFLVILLIPTIHFGLVQRLWVIKSPVDREKCTCDCWDTVFKGSYEGTKENYKPGYKHIYINVTVNTFLIWAISLLVLIWTYQIVRHVTRLIFNGNLRIPMIIVVCGAIYPHYYSWWNFCNYLNDDFYEQWNHQMFFSLTELAGTLMALYMSDLRSECQPRLLTGMISIAMAHIFISASDQFLVNLFIGAEQFKRSRDIGFLVGDILTVLLSLVELFRYSKRKGLTMMGAVGKKHMCTGLAVTSMLVIVAMHI
ncbi:unnamed protein product [Owenia fusiformis]|uniref:Uncharacterized protein n=1 Tax=Owenia fusiformis TaxID=6347 RepID=A0A8J1TF19_OWEFU|nr:unnamed protein product [Owenia fusiformis]